MSASVNIDRVAGTPLPAKVIESGCGYTLSGKLLDPHSAAAAAYGFSMAALQGEQAALRQPGLWQSPHLCACVPQLPASTSALTRGVVLTLLLRLPCNQHTPARNHQCWRARRWPRRCRA
jgi:hypothetical protein